VVVDELPIVDICPFIHGNAADREAVGRAVGEAFESIGFAIIVGHGVPDQLANDVHAAARSYFEQPLAAKLCDAAPEKTKGRGYLPMGIESVARTLSDETPPDLCEALVFANPHRPPNPDRPNICRPGRRNCGG
jgi:isopenicillin N synthase-like dioxygenase